MRSISSSPSAGRWRADDTVSPADTGIATGRDRGICFSGLPSVMLVPVPVPLVTVRRRRGVPRDMDMGDPAGREGESSMSMAEGDLLVSKPTRFVTVGWEWDWERAWWAGRPDGRLLRGG